MNVKVPTVRDLLRLGYTAGPEEAYKDDAALWCLPLSIALAALLGIAGILTVYSASVLGLGSHPASQAAFELFSHFLGGAMMGVALAGISVWVKIWVHLSNGDQA